MIYETSHNNKSRYLLGRSGKNILIFIGVNPSYATPIDYTSTMRKIEGFALENRCDGWMMLNLYPQRAADPDELHKTLNSFLHHQNLKAIKKFLGKGYRKKIIILAAWGNSIDKREYLIHCLKDIYEIIRYCRRTWKSLGTLTQKGNPRHPLFTDYDVPLLDFDIIEYLRKKSEAV